VSTPEREPTEQELQEMRAAYEAELKRITPADVVIQTAVSLINLGGRRLGLVPGAQEERDLEQVRDAIDAVRGLMPVLERRAAEELGPLRDAVSQLQMAYARERQTPGADPAAGPDGPPAGGAGPARPADAPAPGPAAPGSTPGGEPGEGPGPAQSSGRLWVPGR
jgi:hypothetical protein